MQEAVFFFRTESDFQELYSMGLAINREKSSRDYPSGDWGLGLGKGPPEVRPLMMWNRWEKLDLNPSHHNVRVVMGTVTQNLGQRTSKLSVHQAVVKNAGSSIVAPEVLVSELGDMAKIFALSFSENLRQEDCHIQSLKTVLEYFLVTYIMMQDSH